MLNQFNEYILGNIQNPFRENTIENKIEKEQSKIRERLKKINPSLAKQVRVVLDENKAERHIRGGMATKMKYSHLNEKKRI